jgi:arginine exporter protein ArgO
MLPVSVSFLLVVLTLGCILLFLINKVAARHIRRLKPEAMNSEEKGAVRRVLILLLLTDVVCSYVIEPFVVIVAIKYNVGFQPFAFFTIFAMILDWARFFYLFFFGDGKERRPFWSAVEKVLFLVPLGYMFYIFLVSINLLR